MKAAKKLLALLLAGVMCFSLAACGEDGETTGDNTNTGDTNTNVTESTDLTFDITVWCPEAAVDLTTKQIADFNASNTDGITFNATVEAVGEGDAATTMLTSVEDGADIYFFAQDQAARLIQSGGLSKLGVAAAESVSAANAAGVVEACMSGEDMYAYPLTADNGFFMYYDKSIISEDILDDMSALLKACEDNGRTFCFALENGWYVASYFFGAGCTSTWETADDGSFIAINDDFNSETGLIAAKGLYEITTSSAYVNSSAGAEFESAIPAGVVIDGTWDYETIKAILGDDLGATDLPSFTVDGVSYHLGSYNGCKLLGVKPQTDAAKAASLHKLAQYLVSEEAQLERFNALSWGPANLAAQENEDVQANPGLAALLEQAPYSQPQGQIHGSWWDIAKLIAADVKASDGSDEQLYAALQKYEDACAALFNMSADEKEAFTVIGAIAGTNWDTDFPMTRSAETGTQKWYSNDPIYLNAGDEFQVRQGLSWDVQFGAVGDDGLSTKNNYVVEEAGYYYVKLDFDADALTGVVSLVKDSYNAWSVIGSMNGDGWTIDLPMYVQEDGTTFKSDVITFVDGDEFKVRLAHGWDTAYGTDGNNYVVAAGGDYTVVFDSTSGTITLE